MSSLRTFHTTIQRQRGVALIVMMVIMVMGVTAFLVGSLNSTAIQIKRDEITAKSLAQAKEALIGYALSSERASGFTARPGNFPCPDTDAPGAFGYGNEQGSCSTGGGTTIGRLPWKTLSLPELLDGDGEPLWYALSDNFRKSTNPIANPINSDTQGSLLVYDRDGITLLTPPGSEAVAIVFAPGKIAGNQQRNVTLDKTTSSNYLDVANGRNNAIAGGPFIAANKSDSFNDRLMIIRTRDFMPIIERRVAKELKALFATYLSINSVYPYPAPFNSCRNNATCNSSSALCRGHLPYDVWGGSYPLPSTAGGSPWFVENLWYRVIYYSAGTNRLASPPPGCSATLNVSGNSTPALFFMPGIPLGGITRTYPNNNLAWYLEDAENQNMDDIYVTPTTSSNDQLYALP